MCCTSKMKFRKVIVIILCAVIRNSTENEYEFPADFKFGTATSAYQVEGGWDEDGKGVSVWDRLSHSNPSIVKDNSTGDIACDSYNKWREDVQMLKNLTVNYYRFSLSWTRIYPKGFATGVNQPGVDYYDNLINELINNGIEPMITLFHWDSPEMFTAFGGFYNPEFIDFYADYAHAAFTLFGDRVKTWITFNEPKVLCQDYSELQGHIHPQYPNGVIEYLCSHNIIKAHVKTYRIYDQEFRSEQQGRVGITLNFEWSEPASDDPADIQAAELRRQFEFGLYANPVVYGDYPQLVIDRVDQRSKLQEFPKSRLPKFSLAEKVNNRGTYDFIGLNHYNSWLIRATPDPQTHEISVQTDIGNFRYVDEGWEDTEWDGKVVPWGIRHALQWLKKTYKNPEILITECGYPDQTGTLDDVRRINFLRQYMNATLHALIEDHVRITAFTAWSLMDNFEWGQGYTIKFGLYNVDFDDSNRTRTPKGSADYFKSVIQTRRV